MLSEKVLEELVRKTPLSQYLITEAWPDLSTESKLQLVTAVSGTMDSIPRWLSALALADAAPIVRYWASRWTFYSSQEDFDRVGQGAFRSYKPTAEDVAIWKRSKEDTSALVRATVDKGDTISYKTLSAASQFERLVFIRNVMSPSLEPFAEWLSEAIDAGISDDELGQVTEEFVSLPAVRREFMRSKLDFDDGMDAWSAGKGIELAWQVVKKAGPRAQAQLVYWLPTSMGLHTEKVENLAQVPVSVLKKFPYRFVESKEIEAVIELVRNEPTRFPKEVVAALERGDEHMRAVSDEERAADRALHAVERSEATLQVVLKLKESLDEIQESLRGVQEATSRKRGIFG